MTEIQANAVAAWRPGAGDRFHAWLARFGATPKTLVATPEPLWTGDGGRARELAAGALRFGGALVEAHGESPWDQPPPSRAWMAALHSFDWLDDFAAAPDAATRARLADWLFAWIERYGAGDGPGWRPDLTGRRLTCWVCHAPAILDDAGPDRARAFLRAIGRQARYLRRRWRRAPPGLPRFEAAAGMVHAGLALGAERMIAEGVAALGREAARRIGGDGGLASRNPEDLVEALGTLAWTARSLTAARREPAPAHLDALERLAAAIRALRFGDGSLARFHGGGAGEPEQIDRALAASGVRAGAPVQEVMGYHRLATGRAALIFDSGGEGRRAAATDHASLFCIEAAIGRRPVIVNCGPGARFSPDWRRAARAAAAHSGLTIDRISRTLADTEEPPMAAPGHVSAVREEDETGIWLVAEHDGWLRSHGLIHQRRLYLAADGFDLRGVDRLVASGPGPRATFNAAAARDTHGAVRFTIRFHLHPDVEADVFLAGSAIRLNPGGSDVWVMRQSGGALSIEESVYLDERRAQPRATKQIVVRALAKDYRGEVKWTFRRAEPTRPTAPASRAEP
ncbi:heparinase [Pikeienuella piscinae]|uniref:Heparinase n=1 Tax=Pikeienuella piscinae TaxID=2748098 RepID=A0A7L5C1R0_9RHOB|nr:heparinase II/III family protein [Pikeienuella piscinae]QIE57078.1 heparinase [Pikeienuella piscinae]